jgi:signal peptidase I
MDNQPMKNPNISDITPPNSTPGDTTTPPAPESQPAASGNKPSTPPQEPVGLGNPDEDDTPPTQKRSHEGFREALSTIGILLGALLIAGILISSVFQSYQVDGQSMETTLDNNDRLIVWKLPRTISRITGHEYVPNRGDIVIFVESGLAEYGQDNTKQLIKRVIGLPGDRVVVNGDTITIYNKQHPKGFNPDKAGSWGKRLPMGSNFHWDVTLNSHQLFVCGDNRVNSLDSRSFGPIDTSQLVGKLVFRLLPIGDAKTF